MKPIVINEKNRERIAAALEEVQKRSKERTITVDQIMATPARLMDNYDIPAKAFDGSEFSIDLNAQDFPNAYKYRAQSTQYEIKHYSGTFHLMDIERNDTRRAYHTVKAKLSETTKKAILDKAEDFYIYIH